MEFTSRVIGAAMKAAGSNTFVNVCLIGSFAALSVRSSNQQKYVESMEAERDSLLKPNKAMRKTVWEWRNQLFAEAESDSALVPLGRLKAIYGEAPSPATGDVDKKDAKSTQPEVII